MTLFHIYLLDPIANAIKLVIIDPQRNQRDKQMASKIRKHYKGCYRVDLNDRYFGQITKRGNEWHAETRENATGILVRFNGIWSTRNDAVRELTE